MLNKKEKINPNNEDVFIAKAAWSWNQINSALIFLLHVCEKNLEKSAFIDLLYIIVKKNIIKWVYSISDLLSPVDRHVVIWTDVEFGLIFFLYKLQVL